MIEGGDEMREILMESREEKSAKLVPSLVN